MNVLYDIIVDSVCIKKKAAFAGLNHDCFFVLDVLLKAKKGGWGWLFFSSFRLWGAFGGSQLQFQLYLNLKRWHKVFLLPSWHNAPVYKPSSSLMCCPYSSTKDVPEFLCSPALTLLRENSYLVIFRTHEVSLLLQSLSVSRSLINCSSQPGSQKEFRPINKIFSSVGTKHKLWLWSLVGLKWELN